MVSPLKKLNGRIEEIATEYKKVSAREDRLSQAAWLDHCAKRLGNVAEELDEMDAISDSNKKALNEMAEDLHGIAADTRTRANNAKPTEAKPKKSDDADDSDDDSDESGLLSRLKIRRTKKSLDIDFSDVSDEELTKAHAILNSTAKPMLKPFAKALDIEDNIDQFENELADAMEKRGLKAPISAADIAVEDGGGRCAAITSDDTRCKRPATKGNYCKQHAKLRADDGSGEAAA